MEILREKRKAFSTNRYMLVIEDFNGGLSDSVYRIIETTKDFKPEHRFNSSTSTYTTLSHIEFSDNEEVNNKSLITLKNKFFDLI
ncbi:hypothetical protein B5591_22665 [Salmonella enterica]|nr:hypothetical protein [Salmonella enterica]